MTQAVEEVCCPRFDPELWDKRIVIWKDKPFVKDHVRTLMFVPLNFGAVMRRVDKGIRDGGCTVTDHLCLSEHTSRSNMDVFTAVDKPVPGMENIALSGRFFCAAYEGEFKETEAWMRDYERLCEDRGLSVETIYMWYTTCPKCAKKYGENYCVVVGRLSERDADGERTAKNAITTPSN